MAWFSSLIFKVPGVSLFWNLFSIWSTAVSGFAKSLALLAKGIAWLKTGFFAVSTTALALCAGATLWRDPDFFVSRFERFVNWTFHKSDLAYQSTVSGLHSSTSWLHERTSNLYYSIKEYVLGYSLKHNALHDIPEASYLPPLNETHLFNPIAAIRSAYREVAAWQPVSVRLHYLEEKGSKLIHPYISRQDLSPTVHEGTNSATSSYQLFRDVLKSTVYSKVDAVQNSFYDQVIILPRWLADYYSASALKLNTMLEKHAELASSVDGSIPYIYNGGILLAFLAFYGKVLPVLASYVRGIFDISIRQRQERLASKAWQRELERRVKMRGADNPMTVFEETRAEAEFFRSYRERTGNLVKIGDRVEPERPKVVSRAMNVVADSVAIVNQVRVFWPGLLYSVYLARTLAMIIQMVFLDAQIQREHEKVIRNMVLAYGETVISTQNAHTLHRVQSILLAKATLLNWGLLYLSTANHTTVALGVVWAGLSISTLSAINEGMSTVLGPLTDYFIGTLKAPTGIDQSMHDAAQTILDTGLGGDVQAMQQQQQVQQEQQLAHARPVAEHAHPLVTYGKTQADNIFSHNPEI
ncbi:MAG: hypothetical protein EOP45_00195 [Sphingobacteriaceae bacterium]|nr:MAG: hypothetical protein EOP45_00195 [Sphingobacteriaceae bacterium]